MSKRRQVKEALLNKGEEAAKKLAAELHIGNKRLEKWFGSWLKGAKPIRVEQAEGCPFGRGESVRYKSDDPKWIGVVTKAGPEVSEVRWPNNVAQYVSNDVICRSRKLERTEDVQDNSVRGEQTTRRRLRGTRREDDREARISARRKRKERRRESEGRNKRLDD